MRCPRCKAGRTRITETRHPGGKTVRRRLCRKCGKKFRTVEEVGHYVGWARGAGAHI